ncbi:UNVERIFIED_CONTAM: hypothetical protein HDU68_001368 [Siphonaria sp. JEL0065]|nr:hypothetical protein HDU68_001368 [Siphonaria sp. JEL0065]
MISPFQKTGLNIYDVREKCDPGNPLCYSILGDIEAYLNRADIQQELGVDVEYKGCNMEVNQRFMMAGDWMRPYVNLVPEIISEGVHVLVYAGDADFICNYMGNRAWTLELEWEGKDGFNEAPELDWVSKVTGKKAGVFRTFDKLTYLTVYEAGHMVPYDQPEHSKEFINHWINGTSKYNSKKVKLPPMIEVSIINHIRKGVADGTFAQPNAEEKQCLDSFATSELITTPISFTFWSLVAYYTVDPVNIRKVPLHLKLFSIAGVAAGGYGSSLLLNKRMHRQCIQCVLDGRDKTSEFYKATRKIMEDYHPEKEEYFRLEKYKLLRESDQATK